MSEEAIRVLLVSSEASDQEIIEKKLRSSADLEVELTRIETVPAACERLTEESWDLVLLDLALPGEPGIDGFIRLNAQVPETPLVVIASQVTQELATRALDAGATDSLFRGSLANEPIGEILVALIQRSRFDDAIRKRAIVDDATGFYTPEAFGQLVDKQISLATHGGKALLLTRLTVRNPAPASIEAAAHVVKLSFRGSDRVAHLGGGAFAAVAIVQPTEQSREVVLTRLREQLYAHNSTAESGPLDLRFGMKMLAASRSLDGERVLENLPPAEETL